MELWPKSTEASEVLRRELAVLVGERQSLRDRGVSRRMLEKNRLRIVQVHHDLSEALLTEHARP